MYDPNVCTSATYANVAMQSSLFIHHSFFPSPAQEIGIKCSYKVLASSTSQKQQGVAGDKQAEFCLHFFLICVWMICLFYWCMWFRSLGWRRRNLMYTVDLVVLVLTALVSNSCWKCFLFVCVVYGIRSDKPPCPTSTALALCSVCAGKYLHHFTSDDTCEDIHGGQRTLYAQAAPSKTWDKPIAHWNCSIYPMFFSSVVRSNWYSQDPFPTDPNQWGSNLRWFAAWYPLPFVVLWLR